MKNLKIAKKKGFSLVELLVVIAVIGVIAAIAIPAMSGIFGQADTQKLNRNAQNVVASFNAARAAGNQTVFADEPAAVAAIITAPGLSGAGTFASSQFVSVMTPAEAALLDSRIGTTGSGASLTLVYNPVP